MKRGAQIAVVGAGIAGSATCLALARAGLRPFWVTGPGGELDRDAVGDSLAPAAAPILAKLGVRHLLDDVRHRAANTTFSSWGSSRLAERNAIVHLEGPGWVVNRPVFEQALVEAAAPSTDLCGRTLQKAEPRDAGWTLHLDDGTERDVDFVIDASGRSAVVGRRMAALHRADALVAAAAWLPHLDPSVEPTPATLIEAVETGWWYASLLADGRLAIVHFSDADLLPGGISRDLHAWQGLLERTAYVKRWIDDAGFDVVAAPRLYSAGTTWLEAAYGHLDTSAWAAVGDAATAFDPLSSHGMTTALWSGERVGTAAAAWLQGDFTPLRTYDRALMEGRGRFLHQRRALYASESRFAAATFWLRRAEAN